MHIQQRQFGWSHGQSQSCTQSTTLSRIHSESRKMRLCSTKHTIPRVQHRTRRSVRTRRQGEMYGELQLPLVSQNFCHSLASRKSRILPKSLHLCMNWQVSQNWVGQRRHWSSRQKKHGMKTFGHQHMSHHFRPWKGHYFLALSWQCLTWPKNGD